MSVNDDLKAIKKDQDEKTAKDRVAALLENAGIDPAEIGKIERIRLSDYQSVIKDPDGEAQVQDLKATSVVISPKWEAGPEWPVVQQAKPTVIKQSPKRKAPALVGKWQTAVIFPDPQIGYRWVDGQLDPFHDERAIDVALQVLSAHQHDGGVAKVVNLGDFLDLQQQSRFVQEAAFALTTQPAIDYGHNFLARQRAEAPDAELVLLEGNHDRRMQNFVTVNAQAAFGLKRANVPDSWPVMSIPYLLRCDEVDVKYIDAWPAGEYWVNESLRCIHGNKVRSNGSTANAIVKDNTNISTVFGHVHRIESHYKTTHDKNGPVRTLAASPGCLCRVDGAVPSVNGSTGIDGKPAVHWEDWAQGVAVVQYTDHKFYYNAHQILDGQTVIGGQEFNARVDA